MPIKVEIPGQELYDEANECFVSTKPQTLILEHSLVSLSKWESKWCKPFLSRDQKTTEETLDYFRCMTINKDVDPNVYLLITPEICAQINEYIESPMTATTVKEDKNAKTSREIITSELIYYWMIALEIPFECEKWHLNRLLMLVRVCNAKNEPARKMSGKDFMKQNRALNSARKARHHSHG